MSDEQQGPKIIVDEDWKSQVQAEKEAAAKSDGEPGEAEAPDAAPRQHAPTGGVGAIPPATLDVLISSLAAQAMAAMGHLPDPREGHPVVRPDVAKHAIDMLGMLEEKTKGNRTPEESAMLEGILHELRMIFVTTRKESSAPASAPEQTV
jgi:hypothetical protein